MDVFVTTSETDPSELVLVTGASGFIALHCIQQLLEQGYRVRGTLRDLNRADELRDSISLTLPSPKRALVSRLSFVVADLTDDEGWSVAMTGVRYVLHTASPVPAHVPKREEEVTVPALQGTLRVLQAAADAGVERVVQTSSIAAISSSAERIAGRVFTEADWSDLEKPLAPYQKSKTLAETAAWKFMEDLPEEHPMKLAVINPAFVVGPSISGANNASNEIIRKLLDREMPGVPRLLFPLVDVRDVAAAHLLAMTHENAPGERFIVSGREIWFGDIASTLAQAGHRVPKMELPNWVVHMVSWFDPIVRLILKDLSWEMSMSSEKARKRLGWSTRPIEQTVLDTAESILAHRRQS